MLDYKGMFKLICIGISLIILTGLATSVVRCFLLVQKSKVLIANTSPFERKFPNASKRILILGDSTAYGVGAESPELSTAGRIGTLYPEAEVVNLAVSGLKIEGLNEILSRIDEGEQYDIVVIQIGANDIVRLTAMEDIQQGIEKILLRTKQFNGRVVVLHSGTVGSANFFPWFLKPLMTARSYEVREIYKKAAALYSADYIDLIDSPAETIINSDPNRYYAMDFFHLSGEGYRVWFDEIKKSL